MVAAPLNLIPIEKSCYYGSKSSGSQQTLVLQIWQWKMTNDLQVHDCKTVAQSFLPSFKNKNGCLRQERLLRFNPEIFAAMVK